MKKIITSLTILLVCISGFISAYAAGQASGNENDPTVLTLNTYFDSYINTAHPADYYEFTLSKNEKILVECDNVSKSKEHIMTLSGNGIEPIYTTDATDGYSMYITAELNAGTYNISVKGDYASRASTGNLSYHIAVFDELNRGHVVNEADTVMIDDDFELDDFGNNDSGDWLDGFRPHYEYGVKTIEDETDGNSYMAFTPVNSSQYYVFEAKDVYSNKVLCSEFDIKFPSGNIEIQMKQASSNIDTNFKMAGRIRKYAYYLQYYSNGDWKYLFDNTNNWLKLNDTNKWYTMRITLDVRTNTYNIYLEERDSGKIISKAENISFGEECTHISHYNFSSTEKICIDNVKIFESEIDEKIGGYTYIKVPKNGTRQYKYFNTKSVSKKAWSADKWTILSSAAGISIDEDTGILSVSAEAKPGTILVSASRKYYPWVKNTYLVDIDR
ncbi:MAG: hypothetical protein Q4G33_08445 [bacterium]|nr:hypothetical protein [bacterium]